MRKTALGQRVVSTNLVTLWALSNREVRKLLQTSYRVYTFRSGLLQVIHFEISKSFSFQIKKRIFVVIKNNIYHVTTNIPATGR